MGVFDYKSMRGEQAKALLDNALALSEYAYDSTGKPLATGGWAPIGAQALGVTQNVDKQGTFWGETALAPSANVEILGQYDGGGRLIAMGHCLSWHVLWLDLGWRGRCGQRPGSRCTTWIRRQLCQVRLQRLVRERRPLCREPGAER